MALPIANFGFSRSGLDVTFQNLSFNTIDTTTYSWDFGDGTNSTLKIPPTKNYGSEGFFTVKLTVTTGTDESIVEMVVGVGANETILNAPIIQLVNYYIPSTLIDANAQKIRTSITYWQQYLQPLVEIPSEVNVADVHNEFKWPSLVNVLISQLVALDIITYESSRFLLDITNQATVSDSNTTTTTTTTVPRSIKSIETGPTRVEWYSAVEANTELVKQVTTSFMNATSNGGIMFLLRESICQLSKRLVIFLPNCGKLNLSPNPFLISTSPITAIPRSSSLGNLIEETLYIWSGDFTW